MKPATQNRLNPSQKSATLCLLFFLFTGTIFSVVHGMIKTGYTPRDVAVYYSGAEEAMLYPKELPELMEATHVHLFLIPLIFYIIVHLFMQTSLKEQWKIIVVAFTFMNITVFLATPYLIRYVSQDTAFLMLFTEMGFLFSAAVMIYFPLQELLGDSLLFRKVSGKRHAPPPQGFSDQTFSR